ncbi:molybdopterin biosynthesis protein MoeB [Corynebacterium sp. zg254]|uniref:Molybdopterin biosynthesis protein MoeB n=1 Tax=Corynebacterium zhongnanshanii TaxID=2768834 RepID=A0ABQ6VFE1_9CORY|nr:MULTISPECIES: ThiF family adenylyltransferase [Corynebacterium]KAB3523125.1 molybdopterin biosynthesis protein MoeB [Corynebacterium zhongnanshanii]MCR5913771.1 molybdopterin biosynthesis protein MoeB [Corynebacterium sp. zg254]
MSEYNNAEQATQAERYARQVALTGFGAEAQEALAASTVALIGAGGLGSPAIQYLAGAGVGRLILIDDDAVDESNLHRQTIHPTRAVGRAKVDSAQEAALAINPTIQVTTYCCRLTHSNADGLLEGVDVVLDGSDNFPTRHIASAACARHGIPHVWGSVLGFQAQLSVFWAGHGPIYEDLYPHPPAPGSVPNCAEAGTLGPIVGVVGSAMALEAIKLLTGVGKPLMGRIGYFDSLEASWDFVPLQADPSVAGRIIAHGPVVDEILTTTEVPQACYTGDLPLIDVREAHEFQAAFIPGAIHIPLSALAENPSALAITGPAVVYCAAGVRSATAIDVWQKLGASGLVNLAGGIHAHADRGGPLTRDVSRAGELGVVVHQDSQAATGEGDTV